MVSPLYFFLQSDAKLIPPLMGLLLCYPLECVMCVSVCVCVCVRTSTGRVPELYPGSDHGNNSHGWGSPGDAQGCGGWATIRGAYCLSEQWVEIALMGPDASRTLFLSILLKKKHGFKRLPRNKTGTHQAGFGFLLHELNDRNKLVMATQFWRRRFDHRPL